ncbi:insulinase family protein [Treponema primitia]|uniref:insulinase family protein n=1 Tax=Treponema primitia TaxID=88058 RepID=UPI00025550E2|nr:insulinase family protein [Treponema primitia]
MRNNYPENRIFLGLVVKAGSVLEADNERGIAHLVEHMAFNGSNHFSENELISYFESLGMGFGLEVNAYTWFDETVYMLEIPAEINRTLL